MKYSLLTKIVRAYARPLSLVLVSALMFCVPKREAAPARREALDLVPRTAQPASLTAAPTDPGPGCAADLGSLWAFADGPAGTTPADPPAETPTASPPAETPAAPASPAPREAGEGCDGCTLTVSVGGAPTEMTLADYLVGVVAGEVPASYDLEALKAQAVAARTFTLKHMVGEARCRSGCTICTDCRCCQAFADEAAMRRNWGSRYDEYLERVRQAVFSTADTVMECGGKLVNALYHSNSGGRTEDCEAVFAVALPYLVSVESAGEEESPEFSAERTYTKAEFMRLINEAFPDAGMTDPEKDVDVWQRTESGRITLIRLGGTVRTGQQLRDALKLHSTNARFDISGDTVTVTCLGYGHGVGMSQCGANAMAKGGADHETILKHYYTGVELVRYSSGLEKQEDADT